MENRKITVKFWLNRLHQETTDADQTALFEEAGKDENWLQLDGLLSITSSLTSDISDFFQ
ncbi:MAG TPA: hypothetical protein VIU43_04765 [Nitrosospira sp.]